MADVSTRATETPPPVSANGSGPVSGAEALAAIDGIARRPRWPAVLLGIVVGAGGALAATTLLDEGTGPDETEGSVVELATASVEQRDLIEEIEWSGTLGYGEVVAVSGSGGTVTAGAMIGSTVDRGDQLIGVDGQPVIVLFGATPMWRSMSEGDEGIDVLQLETNLAALGYDPDQTVDIDGDFTANTEAMVERWQEDIGAELTGSVELGSVVIIEGPSVVSSALDVGSPANGELASVAPRSGLIDVVASIDGTITSIAPVGAQVEHGMVLYQVDETPVVALSEPDPVVDALTDPTFTALELESALAADGHDPDGEMTVDGVITEASVAAVERWQGQVGLPVTGQTDPGYYLSIDAGPVIDAVLVDDGEAVFAGGPVLSVSESRLAVEVVTDIADADEFEMGQEVTIELADESTAVGTVLAIGPVVQPADPQGSPTVTVEIGVTADDGTVPVEGPVTVISAGEVIAEATVVPTRALVSLAEGGFAVERIGQDGSGQLIGIEIGSFDDGFVEVIDGDLAPGDEVVVPQ